MGLSDFPRFISKQLRASRVATRLGRSAQWLKTQSRALNHGFLRIGSCQNTLIRYTDLDARVRFNVVRTLTYEKYTIVLYQPVSRCSRLRHCGHGDIRGATFAHSTGRKLTRSVRVRDGLHAQQQFLR